MPRLLKQDPHNKQRTMKYPFFNQFRHIKNFIQQRCTQDASPWTGILKIVNHWKSFTCLAKCLIWDIWHGSKYASVKRYTLAAESQKTIIHCRVFF